MKLKYILLYNRSNLETYYILIKNICHMVSPNIVNIFQDIVIDKRNSMLIIDVVLLFDNIEIAFGIKFKVKQIKLTN